MKNCGTWLVVIVVLLLAACAGDEQAEIETDGPPSRQLKAADVKDAVPRQELRSRYGNRSPYQVLGKTYTVMDSAESYRERGIASWYGSKFHGRRTSSGEVFDMYKATAAHKILPLPTYAEVTKLDNGRKVIVKINDRGPFHDDRLIDLSYGAAVKLGMAGAGTAWVEVRAITFGDSGASQTAVKVSDGTFLQAGAFSRRESAEQLAGELMQEHVQPVSIQRGGNLYRVWIGPYQRESELDAMTRRVVELGYERPHRVKR